jgi:hypothetical protein
MKSQLLVDYMDWIAYDAVNIGEREIGFGRTYLTKLRDALGPRLVSANVRSDSGGELASRWVLVDVGEARLGVTGVVGTGFLKWTVVESLVVLDPRAELPAVVEAMREECDAVVVLACMREEEARELGALAGVDIVVTRSGFTREELPEDAPPWVLSGGRKGEKIGRAVFVAGEDGLMLQENREIALDESFASDTEAQSMVDEFKRKAKAARSERSQRAQPERPRYLGHTSCGKCHADVGRRWKPTAHASAMETLVAKDRQSDPACIPCHATGYGQPGGFREMGTTPWLAGVQCEACHGPGSFHVVGGGALPYGNVSALDCVRCHTVAQSPDFNYQRGDMHQIH